MVSFFIMVSLLCLILGCKRKAPSNLCDNDGVQIQPTYAIYFSLKDGSEKQYCSVVCAIMSFSKLKDRVGNVIVTDEISGNKINAVQAFYVESEIVTIPHVKNRIHVFNNKEDALKHLQKFKGNWVENPFPQ